jgi:hypothetical protein
VFLFKIFSGFQGSSVGVMVGQMLMVFLGIMVSQFMPLLVGGVADTSERLVESKMLEWLRSNVVSCRGGKDGLLLVCGDLDCYMFVEDGGGSGRLMGGVALASDRALKRLGGLLRPMFLIGLDPFLRGWWLSRFVNASRLEVSSALKSGPTTGVLLLLRRRGRACVLDSCGDGSLQQFNRLCLSCIVLLVSISTMYCYICEYK